MLRTILLLVALAGSHAFVTSNGQRPAFVSIVVVGQRGRRQNCQQRLFMGMAQPETQIKTGVKTEVKQKQKQKQMQKAKTGGPVSKRKEEFEDAPMYKVMLLEDDSYDSEHVITRMCAVMEDMDEDQAATVFEQAMKTGKAMCGKYPYEMAELFKEQLLRSDPMIFADLEEENKHN